MLEARRVGCTKPSCAGDRWLLSPSRLLGCTYLGLKTFRITICSTCDIVLAWSALPLNICMSLFCFCHTHSVTHLTLLSLSSNPSQTLFSGCDECDGLIKNASQFRRGSPQLARQSWAISIAMQELMVTASSLIKHWRTTREHIFCYSVKRTLATLRPSVCTETSQTFKKQQTVEEQQTSSTLAGTLTAIMIAHKKRYLHCRQMVKTGKRGGNKKWNEGLELKRVLLRTSQKLDKRRSGRLWSIVARGTVMPQMAQATWSRDVWGPCVARVLWRVSRTV